MKKTEYKGIYRITYFTNERADNIHIQDISMKPKMFEGIIENFYPSGKCAFCNEITEQLLVIPYECIRCICPINEYKNNSDMIRGHRAKFPLFEPEAKLSSEEINEVIKPFDVNNEEIFKQEH